MFEQIPFYGFLFKRIRKCQFAQFFFYALTSDKTVWMLLCHLLTYLLWQLMTVEVACLMWENIIWKLNKVFFLSKKEVEDYSNHPRMWCPSLLTNEPFAIPQNIHCRLVHSGCQTQVPGCQNSWGHLLISVLFFFLATKESMNFSTKPSDTTLMIAMKNPEFVGILSPVM